MNYPTVLTDEQLQATNLSRKLNKIFSYVFKTTDADIIYAKGIDAYEYLLFQRHLILIMIVVNVFCIFLVLPSNWFLGDNFETSFQRTTIKNLKPDSVSYWAHLISSISISLATLYILNSYKNSITSRQANELSRRTLLIGNIPNEQRNRPSLLAVFASHFSQCKIEAIQFVYDMRTLKSFQEQLDIVVVAKEFCQNYKRKYNRDLMVKQSEVNESHICCGSCRLCSFCFMSCFKWPMEDSRPGEDFYAEQELYFRSKIRATCRTIVKTPSEFAFITLKSHRQARNVISELNKMKTTDRNQQEKLNWSVRYAPHPDNVEYSDLLNYNKMSKYTRFSLNVLMVFIFIFFTTPTVLLSIFDKIIELRPTSKQSSIENLLISYATTLLQIISTSLLPSLITLISKQMPYEDTASKSHSIMWKTYLFLVLMVIVMPSVGLTSAQAFLSSEINPQCLFPPDNGGYFINYVISSMFLTNISELLKPIDFVTYYFLHLTSRSQADFEGARQALEREFSVSGNHTAVLLMFSVCMTYAISCPLIAPAGLVYLIIKHSVDHYHLFYTYFTKKVDNQLQKTLIVFVKSAVLLMLFQTMISITINTGTGYFSFLAQLIFFLTFAIFLLRFFYNFTSAAILTNGSERKKRLKKQEFCACFYLPITMDKLLRSEAIPDDCISRQIKTVKSKPKSKPNSEDVMR